MSFDKLPQHALKIETPDNQNLATSHIYDKEMLSNDSTQIEPDKFICASFMNNTQALSWIIDETKTLVWANVLFKKYFDISENNNSLENIGVKMIDELYTKYVHLLNTSTPVETTKKILLKNEQEIELYINLFPVKGVEGKKMIGGQAFRLPHTDNNQERQSFDVNEQLNLLKQAGTDAIWEWNMKSGHIFLNDTLVKMIGYQGNETNGLAWWLRRIHPADRDRVSDKVYEAAIKKHLFWEDDYRFRFANGEYENVRDYGYIIYENELPVKMIGSLHKTEEGNLLRKSTTAND